MADGVARVPLPDGKIYHFNIIYNHARSPMSVTPDTTLSRAFTERVTVTLESIGFVNNYYHDRDALPGRNVFTELFRVVDGSDYTIVVLTHGFVQDCWKRYTQMSAFKTLLDVGQSHKFIPISVGLSDTALPQELNTEHVLFFRSDWENDEHSWNKLKRVFVENLPVPVADRDQDLYIVDAYQETHAPDGALVDDYDGNRTGRQSADHSIHQSSGPVDSQDGPIGASAHAGSGQSQGQGSDSADGTGTTGPTGLPSEVSVGRTDLTSRHENDRADARSPAVPVDREERSRDIGENENNAVQSGTGDNSGQEELGAVSGWNAEFNTNGIYDGVSMNLERQQVDSNVSVNLEQRHQAGGLQGQRSSTEYEGRESQPTQYTERRYLNMDGATSLPDASLNLDGGDIETSVVSRLENRFGITACRQDLFTDQTEKKVIDEPLVSRKDDVGNTEQTERKVVADTFEETQAEILSSENIPSEIRHSDHTSADLTPDGTKNSPFVQNTSSPTDQNNEPPVETVTQAHTSDNDTNATAVTNPSTQGHSLSDDVVSMQLSAERVSQNTTETEQVSSGSPGSIGTSSDIDVQEAEAAMYRDSLPPLDDSGIDTEENCSSNRESLTESPSKEDSVSAGSLTELSSPEDNPSSTVPQMMMSSIEDRGTPDGSVEDSSTLECRPENGLPSDETIVSNGSQSDLAYTSNADSHQNVVENGVGDSAVSEMVKIPAISDNEGSENIGDESGKELGAANVCESSESLSSSVVFTSDESSTNKGHVSPPVNGDVSEKATLSSAGSDSEGKIKTDLQAVKQVTADVNKAINSDRGTKKETGISVNITKRSEDAVLSDNSQLTRQSNGHPEVDEPLQNPDVGKTSTSTHISSAELDESQKDKLSDTSVTSSITQSGSYTQTGNPLDTNSGKTSSLSSHSNRDREVMPEENVISGSGEDSQTDADAQGQTSESSKGPPQPSRGISMAKFACRVLILIYAMLKAESPFYV